MDPQSLDHRLSAALTAFAALTGCEIRLELVRASEPLSFTFGWVEGPVPSIRRPLVAARGVPCGEMIVRGPQVEDLAPQLIATVVPLVTMCVDLEAQLVGASFRVVRSRLAAQTDRLTGAGNRLAFERALAQAEDYPLGLVVVDLDGLKEVNDTRGHAAGDELIVAAATALRLASRPGDLLARLGGDEFAVVVSGAAPSDLPFIVERFEVALAAAGVAASVGFAAAADADEVATALQRADADMYEVKRSRRVALPRQRTDDLDEQDALVKACGAL